MFSTRSCCAFHSMLEFYHHEMYQLFYTSQFVYYQPCELTSTSVYDLHIVW